MVRRDEAERVVIEVGPELKRLLFLETPQVWLDVDLTMVQFKSLIVILNHKNTTPTKLAKALGVTPANVTGVVERLVKMGLVHRAGSPDDRRVLRLEATEKTRTLLSRIVERSADDMSRILELMTPGELSHLAQGLTALVSAARKRRAISEGTASSEARGTTAK
jgi:MarR family transcriptional regulator, organic hydroperoxide resistance regulator